MVRAFLVVLFTTCLGDAEEIRLSIRTLAVGNGAMPIWHLAADKDTFAELQWSVEQPSDSVTITTGRELLLYSKEIVADGKEEYKVARKLAIPETAKEILLVGWPVEGEQKAELMVVADNLKKAGSHDWLAINTSKQVVTLRFGVNVDALQLESMEAKPYHVHLEPKQGSAVQAQMRVRDKWRTIYSTYWAAPDKQRSLVLFYDNGKRVKLHRVVDVFESAE